MGPARSKRKQPASKPEAAVTQTMLKADSVTLSLVADKEGRIRANTASFEHPVILLAGQMMQVQWAAGQVVVTRLNE